MRIFVGHCNVPASQPNFNFKHSHRLAVNSNVWEDSQPEAVERAWPGNLVNKVFSMPDFSTNKIT